MNGTPHHTPLGAYLEMLRRPVLTADQLSDELGYSYNYWTAVCRGRFLCARETLGYALALLGCDAAERAQAWQLYEQEAACRRTYRRHHPYLTAFVGDC